jgi:parvulin-like peptidyl-prolyl isomerase
MEQLVAAIGASGKLVTPQEAQVLYARNNQELSTEAVVLNGSNFLASVTVTPEALTQFYSNNLASYRIPERVQVNYVKFAVSNFLTQAETELTASNLNENVQMALDNMGTNYSAYFTGVTNAEQAKARIREEIVKGRAQTMAYRAAAQFATPLIEAETMKPEMLAAQAKSNDLPLMTTPPFERNSAPPGVNAGPDFAKLAFDRTAEDPFAGPIRASDGAYVIGFNKRLPSEIPPMETIREQVTEDFKERQATQLAVQKANEAYKAITNAVAQGKSFSDAAAAAAVKTTTVPPFSISTRSLPGDIEDQISLGQLKQLAFATDPGQAVLQPTAQGALILFVKEKLPVDESKMQQELPEFMNYLRQSRTQEAFNNWFRREAEKGLRDTPLAQPQPPPAMTSGAES